MKKAPIVVGGVSLAILSGAMASAIASIRQNKILLEYTTKDGEKVKIQKGSTRQSLEELENEARREIPGLDWDTVVIKKKPRGSW